MSLSPGTDLRILPQINCVLNRRLQEKLQTCIVILFQTHQTVEIIFY